MYHIVFVYNFLNGKMHEKTHWMVISKHCWLRSTSKRNSKIYKCMRMRKRKKEHNFTVSHFQPKRHSQIEWYVHKFLTRNSHVKLQIGNLIHAFAKFSVFFFFFLSFLFITWYWTLLIWRKHWVTIFSILQNRE